MISLILATKGHRIIEIQRFFESIINVSKKTYELIIVCQDEEGYLNHFLKEHNKYPISVYYMQPGLSKARNFGLKKAKGKYIAFPDDDCVYTNNLIENVDAFLQSHKHIDRCFRHWACCQPEA